MYEHMYIPVLILIGEYFCFSDGFLDPKFNVL